MSISGSRHILLNVNNNWLMLFKKYYMKYKYITLPVTRTVCVCVRVCVCVCLGISISTNIIRRSLSTRIGISTSMN